ncbi:type II toxin-antitoxin system RelE/ParE family toxin [bacterium]|nr:type II toxin-antitoxin system RelE/ParE family toxin [bacterium]
MYKVLIERAAERELKRLERTAFDRIIPAIKKLKANPRPRGCNKITGSKSDWRIRVGEYRVIYEIDEKASEVKIMRVSHRKDAYK